MSLILLISGALCLLAVYVANYVHQNKQPTSNKTKQTFIGVIVFIVAVATSLVSLGLTIGWQKSPFVALGLLSLVGIFWVLIKGTRKEKE